MQSTHPGRPAVFRRAATAAALTSLVALAAAASLLSAPASAGTSAPISVRVEGTSATLLPATDVVLSAVRVTKNGVAADSCSGRSAAGALEAATHGHWTATWSASYKAYFVSGIEGLTFSKNGSDYWSFWVNDAPSTAGICSYDPKPGDRLLFFPDCFGKKCPTSAGVLMVNAASVAVVGKPFTVSVIAYSDDAKALPAAAVGVTVSGGGVTAKTGAGGTANLVFTHAGALTLKVSAPHAIRTEASVCVRTAAAKTCA
jgi:hypothetical protein